MDSKCPLCKKQSQELWQPFCSKRCKEIDLGRWFLGNYNIPTEESIDPQSHNNESYDY